MIKAILFYITIILILMTLVDFTFEWSKKAYLLYGLLLIFGLLSLHSSVKEYLCKKEETEVSIQEFCDQIQPGDLLGFINKDAFTWWKYILITSLAESYLHHSVVLEHNGRKYVYHAYDTSCQQKRIEDGDSKEEYIVGKFMDWDILLEPLESYIQYIKRYNTGIRVQRPYTSSLSYSSEINTKVVESLQEKNLLACHCCIFVGEYLSRLSYSKNNYMPYYINHVLVYIPNSLDVIYPIKEKIYYRLC